MREITHDEERRLLDACTGPLAHLRPIVIAALDTGMRRTELQEMRWRDADLDHGVITIRDSKTTQNRQVSITERLSRELSALYEQGPKDQTERVFADLEHVRRSFTAARTAAGLLDVRFYDLRYTHAAREA